MRVVPEECHGRTAEGSAKNRQLANLRQVLNVEVRAEGGVTGDVGKHGECTDGYDGATYRQAVQAVSQIYGVRRTYHHKHHEKQERHIRQRPQIWMLQQNMNDQIRAEFLKERDNELR